MSTLEQLNTLLPEIIVVLTALTILMLWVFSQRDNRWLIMMLVIGASLVAVTIALSSLNETPLQVFAGQVTIDRFGGFLRILFLLIAPLALIMAVDQLERFY